MKKIARNGFLIGFSLWIGGCSNSFNTTLPNQLLIGSNTATTPTPTSSPSANQLVISTVTSSTTGTTSQTTTTPSPPPLMTVFFNTSKSTSAISEYCNINNATNARAKPCLCQFKWNEINPFSGSNTPIPRTVQTPLIAVQPGAVSCNAPEVFHSEIKEGTILQVSVQPSGNNSNFFTIASFPFTKKSVAVSGSFQDSQGQIFDNILHYACFNKTQRGLKIQSRATPGPPHPTTGEIPSRVYATLFCLTRSDGSKSSTSASECKDLGAAEFSAQAYYFNLFVRKTGSGSINQSNASFVCPFVKESLNSNNTKGTENQPWPLDTTFALSLAATSSFPIGVEANTRLGATNDATNTNTSCFPVEGGDAAGGGGGGGANGITSGCLGFAAPTQTDGTCPSFKDSAGSLRPTFRLRRYVAVYPRTFDTTGKLISGQAQPIDTVYVLDRPVKGPASADPTKPYTMLGPKPCPFAYLDQTGVTSTLGSATTPNKISGYNASYGYVGTSNPAWAGTNVDGTELPNIDDFATNSCSAAVPILNADKTKFIIHTINKKAQISKYQHVFIRPVQPFFPHYEEDTSFKACAPQASPIIDPPLHFSRDTETGNVAWCAESYPSQNPSVSQIDPNKTGFIANYTSHVVKGSSSNECSRTLPDIPTSYPNNPIFPLPNPSFARHFSTLPWEDVGSTTVFANKTCDRTVSSTTMAWYRYPLLAPAKDIEASISTDNSYMCSITYDNKQGKTNKPTTPSDGCCDRNSVTVPTLSGPRAATGTAHLEPDAPCGTPEY